jgi:hypothetical protein
MTFKLNNNARRKETKRNANIQRKENMETLTTLRGLSQEVSAAKKTQIKWRWCPMFQQQSILH